MGKKGKNVIKRKRALKFEEKAEIGEDWGAKNLIFGDVEKNTLILCEFHKNNCGIRSREKRNKNSRGKYNLPKWFAVVLGLMSWVKLHKKREYKDKFDTIRVNCIYLKKLLELRRVKNDYGQKRVLKRRLKRRVKSAQNALFAYAFASWQFGNNELKYHYDYKTDGVCGFLCAPFAVCLYVMLLSIG